MKAAASWSGSELNDIEVFNNNDNLVFCNICATKGFPHEAIRFVQVGITEEIVPFDFTTEQVLLEDKKTKKKRWQQIIDAAKEALENNDNTKKGIIKKTAELLEKNGMPLEMICGTISREFHEFASKNYVTECLDSKYKDMTQSHPTTRTKAKENLKVEVGNVRLPNNGKNVTEQKGEAEEQQREFEIIRPEDYIIEDLPKYSSQLKDRIIIYLDEELKKLTKEVQSRNN